MIWPSRTTPDSRQDTDCTAIWNLYQKGVDHHNRAGLYTAAEQAHRFFEGDQWWGLESGGENLPSYNFIQPTCEYKIAMVAMKRMAISFSPQMDRDVIEVALCKEMNARAREAWERTRMDERAWEAVKEACITGNSWLYVYNAQLESQVIDGVNLYLGDEQETDLQAQPYILIYERRPVEDIKAEARKNGIPEDEIASIVPDEETSHQIGEEAKNEVKAGEGKCSSLLYLTRREGSIAFSRATRSVLYQPEQVVEGLTRYPIAPLCWLPRKGSARGIGEVSALIPNQIECNRLLARRVIATKFSAFPKPVYSETAIRNPEDVDRVGMALSVSGAVSRVADAFSYIQPAPLSGDAQQLQEELIGTTQKMASTGDAALGNVNPEQASGAAIIAARDQSAIPLNEQSARFHRFVEDLANIWYEMIAAYAGEIEIETPDGPVVIPADEMLRLQPRVRVDVSPVDPYSKFAQEQQLAGFLQMGQISFEEYVEALDEDSVAPKSKLEDILKARAAAPVLDGRVMAAAPAGMPGGQVPAMTGGGLYDSNKLPMSG